MRWVVQKKFKLDVQSGYIVPPPDRRETTRLANVQLAAGYAQEAVDSIHNDLDECKDLDTLRRLLPTYLQDDLRREVQQLDSAFYALLDTLETWANNVRDEGTDVEMLNGFYADSLKRKGRKPRCTRLKGKVRKTAARCGGCESYRRKR